MSNRPIQIGDFVDISGPGVNQRYIIRNITTEGIHVSTEQSPDTVSLLVGSGNDWKIHGTDTVYQIIFSAAPELTLILSNLPLDQLKEVALFTLLPTAKKVIEFCKSAGRHDLCRDIDFWNRWEQLHPPHPKWIFWMGRTLKQWSDDGKFGEGKVDFFKGHSPRQSSFYDYETDDLRRVTEDELDTIVSKEPFTVTDPDSTDSSITIQGKPETGIKSVTLRDFIERMQLAHAPGKSIGDPEKPEFAGITDENKVTWE